jgi:hypothetical protein
MKVLGVQVTLFPMWVALQTHIEHSGAISREVQYHWSSFNEVKARYGFQIGNITLAEYRSNH